MPFCEIPRHRWSPFLDDFSRDHRGCQCSLDVDSTVAGSDREAKCLSFQGATFEAQRHGPEVQVFVGDHPSAHVTHSVSQPTAIWLETSDDGRTRGLRIEADEGSLLLRFRSPQPAEFVETFLP
jgi:Family of unknown function (DUF5335)